MDARDTVAVTGVYTCHWQNSFIYWDTGSSFSCTHELVAKGYILSLCWWTAWHFFCPALLMLPLKRRPFVQCCLTRKRKRAEKMAGAREERGKTEIELRGKENQVRGAEKRWLVLDQERNGGTQGLFYPPSAQIKSLFACLTYKMSDTACQTHTHTSVLHLYF